VKPTSDQAARDAVRDLERTLVVEASAGTGKTELLCDRALEILRRPGFDPAGLVAITFTEKAAAEMSARLRRRLEDELRADADEQLAAALAAFDRAHISTIHSFAATLLRERPVEAGVDPAFVVADDVASGLLFEEAWDEWLRAEAARRPGPAAWEALWTASGRPREDWLGAVARALVDEREFIAPGGACGGGAAPALADALAAALAAFSRVRAGCRDAEDDCFRSFLAMEGLAAALAKGEWDGAAAAAVGSHGRKGNWPPGVKEELDVFRKRVKDLIPAAADELRGRVLLPAVPWLEAAAAAYAARKDARGELDFDDLLARAAALVRDRDARAYFHRRFAYFLVDEFQDTDPRQVELVFYLAEAGEAADDWRRVQLRPGKLFVVGDPKQSIYRFRRADVATYAEAQEVALRSGGELVRLTDNFRAGPRLIDFTNAVFRPLFGAGEPPYQAAYGELRTSALTAAKQKDAPGVWVLAADAPFADEREAAAATAAFIARAVAEGSLTVYDKAEGRRRPAVFRDFALLFRAWTNVGTWEDALDEAGVPFYTQGGRAFYRRREVKALVAAARAIDNPADAVAFVATLMSPLFGVAGEELLELQLAGGGWDYRVPLPPAAPSRFRRAWEVFAGLHARRGERSPAATLAELVRETKFPATAALWGGGPRAAANVRKVLTSARRFAAAGGFGLRDFARWLDDRERREEAEHESPALDPGDNFVRLMTVHGAKGLEFGVVVLPDLARREKAFVGNFVDRRRGALHLALGSRGEGWRTPGYYDAAEEEKRFLEAEKYRLLYVAATRARELLVLPEMEKLESESYRRMWEEATRTPANFTRVRAEGAPPPPAEPPAGREAPAFGDAYAAWRRGRDEALADGAAWRPPVPVTTVAEAESEPEREFEERRPEATLGEKRGRALHAAMAALGPAAAGPPDDLAVWACRAEGLEDEATFALVRRWVEECRRAAPVAAAERAGVRAWREVPLSLDWGGWTVNGRVDLVYEDAGGMVLVDYKTREDALGEAAAREKYRGQLAVYAAALRRVTGLPVARAWAVVLPAAGDALAVDAGGGEELAAAGEALLGRPLP